MKKTILFFFLKAVCITLQAQQVSNMQTSFTGSDVEVTFTLTTDKSLNLELQYSADNGNSYHSCHTVSGDLQSQTSGNKKIVWECVKDGMFKADVVLKIAFKINLAMAMVFVEGGTFTMGCTSEQDNDCWSDERPAHRVTLDDFYVGKYEVTQAQWKMIMGYNPSHFKGDNLPVEQVSWNDVQIFIRKLNAQTGEQYRLPTEAEWEYAARGGKKSCHYKYSGSNVADSVAWYWNDSRETTHPVGTKSPNEIGIYDMSGNVWEWCSDWYGDYTGDEQTDPQGPPSGSRHVLRGGRWNFTAGNVRVSTRDGYLPDYHDGNMGFRLVCGSQ